MVHQIKFSSKQTDNFNVHFLKLQTFYQIPKENKQYIFILFFFAQILFASQGAEQKIFFLILLLHSGQPFSVVF